MAIFSTYHGDVSITTTGLGSVGVYGRELVELIFVQPYCRIKNVVDSGIAQRQTAATYLQQLTHIGVLHEAKVAREKLFINPRLMWLLTTEETGDLSFPPPTQSAGSAI
jgi:hypothetical protein